MSSEAYRYKSKTNIQGEWNIGCLLFMEMYTPNSQYLSWIAADNNYIFLQQNIQFKYKITNRKTHLNKEISINYRPFETF